MDFGVSSSVGVSESSNNLGWLVLILIVIIFGYLIIAKKIRIDFESLFKKGFKRLHNDFGLFCYTGKQGTGKTFSAIMFLEKQRKRYNQIVLTNVRSYADYIASNEFEAVFYYANIEDLIAKSEELHQKGVPIIIFFDEIFTVLTKHHQIQKEILSFISQLRKRKIILVTTAQEWAEINMTFRRYIRFQISCRMFSVPFIKTAFYFNSLNDGDGIKWDEMEQDFIAPLLEIRFGKAPKEVIEKYDTLETIETNK